MPHKHTVKTYVKNGYYHIYNRGVEKRIIFQDNDDYTTFLYLLKYYLSPEFQTLKLPHETIESYKLIRPRPLVNLSEEVNLIAYCLMPNHFHLLINQITIDGMTKLMRRLSTTYVMYFNKKYERVGPLFQGKYKASRIKEDSYLLHLSRYIHLNPEELLTRSDLVSYPYSSYPYYLGLKKATWIKPHIVLNFFKKKDYLLNLKSFNSYKKFVEENPDDPKETVGTLSLD